MDVNQFEAPLSLANSITLLLVWRGWASIVQLLVLLVDISVFGLWTQPSSGGLGTHMDI